MPDNAVFSTEFIRYLSSLGVGGAIAGIIFIFYRKDSQQWQEAWKGQTEILITVVKDNTEAVTALISRLDQRLDDGLRNRRHSSNHGD